MYADKQKIIQMFQLAMLQRRRGVSYRDTLLEIQEFQKQKLQTNHNFWYGVNPSDVLERIFETLCMPMQLKWKDNWELDFEGLEWKIEGQYQICIKEHGKKGAIEVISHEAETIRQSQYSEQEQREVLKKWNKKMDDYETWEVLLDNGPTYNLDQSKIYSSTFHYLNSFDHYVDRKFINDGFKRSLYTEKTNEHIILGNSTQHYEQIYMLGQISAVNGRIINLVHETTPILLAKRGCSARPAGLCNMQHINEIMPEFEPCIYIADYIAKLEAIEIVDLNIMGFDFESEAVSYESAVTQAAIYTILADKLNFLQMAQSEIDYIALGREAIKKSTEASGKEALKYAVTLVDAAEWSRYQNESSDYIEFADTALILLNHFLDVSMETDRTLAEFSQTYLMYYILYSDLPERFAEPLKKAKQLMQCAVEKNLAWETWYTLICVLEKLVYSENTAYQDRQVMIDLQVLMDTVKRQLQNSESVNGHAVSAGALAMGYFVLGTGCLIDGNLREACNLLESAHEYMRTVSLPEKCSISRSERLLQKLLYPIWTYINRNLAEIYVKNGQFQKAKELLEEGLRVIDKNKDSFQKIVNISTQAQIYSSLTNIAVSLSDNEKAQFYMEQSLEYSKRAYALNNNDLYWLRYLIALYTAVHIYNKFDKADFVKKYAGLGIDLCRSRPDSCQNKEIQQILGYLETVYHRVTKKKGFFSKFFK